MSNSFIFLFLPLESILPRPPPVPSPLCGSEPLLPNRRATPTFLLSLSTRNNNLLGFSVPVSHTTFPSPLPHFFLLPVFHNSSPLPPIFFSFTFYTYIYFPYIYIYIYIYITFFPIIYLLLLSSLLLFLPIILLLFYYYFFYIYYFLYMFFIFIFIIILHIPTNFYTPFSLIHLLIHFIFYLFFHSL